MSNPFNQYFRKLDSLRDKGIRNENAGGILQLKKGFSGHHHAAVFQCSRDVAIAECRDNDLLPVCSEDILAFLADQDLDEFKSQVRAPCILRNGNGIDDRGSGLGRVVVPLIRFTFTVAYVSAFSWAERSIPTGSSIYGRPFWMATLLYSIA